MSVPDVSSSRSPTRVHGGVFESEGGVLDWVRSETSRRGRINAMHRVPKKRSGPRGTREGDGPASGEGISRCVWGTAPSLITETERGEGGRGGGGQGRERVVGDMGKAWQPCVRVCERGRARSHASAGVCSRASRNRRDWCRVKKQEKTTATRRIQKAAGDREAAE